MQPGEPRSPERVITLQGGRNFRDLGGYAAQDGRTVKWGVLFRSGSLAGLKLSGDRFVNFEVHDGAPRECPQDNAAILLSFRTAHKGQTAELPQQ